MASQSLTLRWLRQNIQPYPRSDVLYSHVAALLPVFPTLRPKTDIYTYDDGRTQLLLCIHGLLPISFRRSSYHIPVALWITRDYPREPPIAFVVPTPDMLVKPGKYMDVSGRCLIEYLSHWARKSEGCDLLSLVHAMRDHFSHDPPVYSKPKQQNPAPASAPGQTPTNASSPGYAARPPPPLPPHTPSSSTPPHAAASPTPNGRPSLPPKPIPSVSPPLLQPASPAPPASAIFPTRYNTLSPEPHPIQLHTPHPALPPKPPPHPPVVPAGPPPQPLHSPYAPPSHSRSSSIATPSSPWQAHPPSASVPILNTPSRFSLPPGPPPVPALPSAAQPPPSVPVSPPGPYTYPTAHAISQPPPPAPAPPRVPPPNLLDDEDPSGPSTATIPASAPAPAPPRPPNPELLRLHASVHDKLTSELASLSQAMALDAERLRAHQRDLLAGEPAIRDEMARLEAVRDVCRGVASRMRDTVDRADRNVTELKRKGDPPVDELVCAPSIVHNQLVDLVAEDNAIEDTIYHLHRALNAGRIDLDRFLRTMRVLAEEQFMKRALVEKIQAAVPMGGWS